MSETLQAKARQFRSSLLWHLAQMREQFFSHDCLAAAGALTYTTLFAVVPLMTVTYTFFSLLPEYAHLGQEVQSFIFSNFVPGSSDVVQEKLVEFADRARNLTSVGALILFITAFMTLVTIEKSFNRLWHVAEPRRGLQRFLLYWGVLSLGPACLIVGLLSSLYLLGLPLVSDLDTLGIREIFLSYLPVILSVAAFTVLYFAVPNCHVPFRHALAGGVVTMIVFQTALAAFARSSTWFSYDAIYGTFAAVPVFLLWLYLVWVIILCGAIFVRSLSLSREPDGGEPLLIKAARVLGLLQAAHQEGRSVSDQDINELVILNQRDHDRVFGVFNQMKLLSLTEDERWMLGRSLKTITLWDLYQQLPDGLALERLDKIDDLPGVVGPLRSITQFGSNEMSVSLDMVLSS
ncbi:MAG: YihY family inner membrane protein [Pseudomonadota bacterium]